MLNPRILVAPGPYKESLSSFEVADSICEGIKDILPNAKIIKRPLSDGGSGIAKILTEASGGKLKYVNVFNPIGNKIKAYYGILGDNKTAIIESAQAAGLSLIPVGKRNPLLTSTFGVGQLIQDAVNEGVKKIIIGCGDSGTNDCGIGCVAALGVKFYNNYSVISKTELNGKILNQIIDYDIGEIKKKYSGVKFIIACNLTSVLCGQSGTSIIYGPQKGANPSQVKMLHQGVKSYVDLIYKKEKIDLSFIPGAGAAGGLAASLYAFLNAKLLYSIDVVDKFLNLDSYLSKVDLVLTGEGRIDDRTATGKVACGIALKAKKYGIPVIAIVGSISNDYEDIYYNGIDAVESITDGPISLEESMKSAKSLIKNSTARVMRFVYNLPFKLK